MPSLFQVAECSHHNCIESCFHLWISEFFAAVGLLGPQISSLVSAFVMRESSGGGWESRVPAVPEGRQPWVPVPATAFRQASYLLSASPPTFSQPQFTCLSSSDNRAYLRGKWCGFNELMQLGSWHRPRRGKGHRLRAAATIISSCLITRRHQGV